MKKLFKRTFAVLLAGVLLFGSVPAVRECFFVTASAKTYSGFCGDLLSPVTWSLNTESGVMTIGGVGNMRDFNVGVKDIWYESLRPWKNYTSYIKEVKIGSGVTGIGDFAFYGCTDLESVTMGNSVTRIGSSAFYNTAYYNDESNWTDGALYIGDHLIRVKESVSGAYTVREGTLYIANDAFLGCKSLTSVYIPDSVTNIGAFAFHLCGALKSVTIPHSVKEIRSGTFYNCGELTSVTIPDSVTSIGTSAFNKCCDLKDIYYSGSKLQWEAISIGDSNEYLEEAEIHYVNNENPGFLANLIAFFKVIFKKLIATFK